MDSRYGDSCPCLCLSCLTRQGSAVIADRLWAAPGPDSGLTRAGREAVTGCCRCLSVRKRGRTGLNASIIPISLIPYLIVHSCPESVMDPGARLQITPAAAVVPNGHLERATRYTVPVESACFTCREVPALHV